MNTLLELTWRGALMLVVVASLDRLCAAKISARVRRAWWLLVPLAFLVTVPLPILPAVKSVAAQSIGSHGTVALAVEVATHPAGQVAASAPTWRPRKWWAVVIVLSGSAFYLLNVLARTSVALRRFGGMPLCTDPALLHVLEECQAKAGVVSRVGLVISERVPAPLLLGWLRPRILLPDALVASSSREQLRGVLFHELAHVRTWDVPCTFLFTLVCALHWFNPAAHLALRWWAQFREEAADEAAVTFLGTSTGLAYGETLLHVLRASNGPRQASLAVLAVVGPVGQLRKRLLMLKQHSSRSPHRILSFTIFVSAAAVLLHPVRAMVPDDKPTATPSSGEAKAVTVKPPTDQRDLAIQVAGTTAVVLLSGNTQMHGDNLTVMLPEKGPAKWSGNVTVVEGTHMTSSSPGTMIWKGGVEAQIKVPEHPPVILTGSDLIFVRQEPAPSETGMAGENPVPTPDPGKLDASGKPTTPPPALWELQFSGVPVAIIPAGVKSGKSMNIDSTKGTTYTTKTGVATFLGKVTLTLTIPGQPPIKITGEDLVMVPRW